MGFVSNILAKICFLYSILCFSRKLATRNILHTILDVCGRLNLLACILSDNASVVVIDGSGRKCPPPPYQNVLNFM